MYYKGTNHQGFALLNVSYETGINSWTFQLHNGGSNMDVDLLTSEAASTSTTTTTAATAATTSAPRSSSSLLDLNKVESYRVGKYNKVILTSIILYSQRERYILYI